MKIIATPAVPRQSYRRFRFGLRSLFVAVTVVSVATPVAMHAFRIWQLSKRDAHLRARAEIHGILEQEPYDTPRDDWNQYYWQKADAYYGFHRTMREKYERAAETPWLEVEPDPPWPDMPPSPPPR